MTLRVYFCRNNIRGINSGWIFMYISVEIMLDVLIHVEITLEVILSKRPSSIFMSDNVGRNTFERPSSIFMYK